MSNMRDDFINASRLHFKAHVEKHRINAENLMSNPAGIGEHGDIINEIEKELKEVAHYEDLIDTMKKYFPEEEKNEQMNLFEN